MLIQDYFPFWKQLTSTQQSALQNACSPRTAKKGAIVHNGSEDCVGLIIVTDGQLRAYIFSEEGKEITLYRLFVRDMCLFSASCMLRSIEFEIFVEAERDTEMLLIPTAAYQALMKESAAVANYTNEVMSSRFSDVMWLMDQILYKRLDSRLAAFLLEECRLSDAADLAITHETIARHLGSAREVITRMLKYFQSEGIVLLSRGGISVLNQEKLTELATDSIR